MKCPGCNYSDSHVVYTRHKDSANHIERRRECLKCGKRFTTHEQNREKEKQH